MNELEHREKPPEDPAPRPQKKWALVLDVIFECLLFTLLQYMLSCMTLSFWTHPLRLFAIFIQFGLYAKFYHDMDKGLGKFWPGLALSVLCVGVVIALVAFVGYFPVGEAPVRLPWD